MASIYKPLPYIIGEVVDIIKTKLIDSTVNYQYGTTTEVVNTLKKMAESKDYKNLRYPLVWLVIPDSLEETVDNRLATKRSVEDVTIIICNQTKKDYSTMERYENNIIPILRPIYDLLIYYIENSGKFASTNKFYHKYTENLQWGREGLYGNTGNVFNDYIDAITIDGLNLRIIENC